MTKTTQAGLIVLVALMAMLVVAFTWFVTLDDAGKAGVVWGVGLGLVNLAVGWWVTTRALRHGMKSAMITLLGGFFVRLVVVATLILVFHRIDGISEIAFALTFMVFFFAYLAVEVILVERTLNGNGRAA